MWLLLSCLAFSYLVIGAKSVSVVSLLIYWMDSPSYRIISRVMINRADINLKGVSNHLWGIMFLHILKGSSFKVFIYQLMHNRVALKEY